MGNRMGIGLLLGAFLWMGGCFSSEKEFPKAPREAEDTRQAEEDWETLLQGNPLPGQAAALLAAGADVNYGEIEDGGFQGLSPLMLALRYDCDPGVIRVLLDGGAAVDQTDRNGRTPLFYAAQGCGDLRVFHMLIEAGAQVNLRDRNDWTPLHEAALHQQGPEAVGFLLEAGAEADAATKLGQTPLTFALGRSSGYAQPAMVGRLLDAGADPLLPDGDGVSPWEYADRNEDLFMTEPYFRIRFARNGGSPGGGPLFKALRGGTESLMLFMERKGGEGLNGFDERGRTPLLYALQKGLPAESVALLLRSGADVNLRGVDRKSPLMAALEARREEAVLNLLWEAGASVQGTDLRGRSVLMYAAASRPDPVFLEEVLAKGAKVNRQDRDSRTALFHAAEKGSPEVAAALLQAGADGQIRDRWGKTALYLAAEKQTDPRMIDLLLDAGVDGTAGPYREGSPRNAAEAARNNPALQGSAALARLEKSLRAPDAGPALFAALAERAGAERVKPLLADLETLEFRNGEGDTPLQAALRSGAPPEVLRLLLQSGSRVASLTEREDLPALALAVLKGRGSEVVSLLIEAGAPVTGGYSYTEGATALMLAARYCEDPGVIDLLLRAGADPDAVDALEDTALLLLLRNGGSPEAALALVRGGANLLHRDGEGRNAWFYLQGNPLYQKTPLYVAVKEELEAQF